MNFINYYIRLLSCRGVPNLDTDQHKRLLNIVSLEVRINEVEKMKKEVPNNRYIFMRHERLKKQLFKLTELDHGANLIDDMLLKSKNS